MRNRRGFTLIELLVVIAIIGVLSAVIIAALNAARAKSRDVTRKQEVHQLSLALNSYASDNNWVFPTPAGASCLGVATGQTCWPGYILNGGGSGFPGNSALNTLLASYLPNIPKDPQPSRPVGDAYVYFTGQADVHCNGVDNVPSGAWIAWEPDVVSPMSDVICAPGRYACCSALGCGSHYFCVYKVNQ